MPEGSDGKPPKRFAASARRLNHQPILLRSVRRARERLLGDEEFVDRLSAARGRPSDLAVQQLAELRGAEPGVLSELGLTALQAWQRLAESQDRGRARSAATTSASTSTSPPGSARLPSPARSSSPTAPC
jgi:hypothetical protein